MVVEPRTISFGRVNRNDGPQTKIIKLTRGDGGPIHPKIESTGHENVAAEVREIKAGEEYEVEVTIKPPWPNGYLRGQMKFDTGIEDGSTQEITVYASIPPRLRANPSRILVRRGQEEPQELTARLIWDSAGPAKVTDVSVSDPELKATLEKKDDRQLVKLTVPPNYESDLRRGHKVIVKTDDPQVPEYAIGIYVTNVARNRANRIRRGTLQPTSPRQDGASGARPAPTKSDFRRARLGRGAAEDESSATGAKPPTPAKPEKPDKTERPEKPAKPEETASKESGSARKDE